MLTDSLALCGVIQDYLVLTQHRDGQPHILTWRDLLKLFQRVELFLPGRSYFRHASHRIDKFTYCLMEDLHHYEKSETYIRKGAHCSP